MAGRQSNGEREGGKRRSVLKSWRSEPRDVPWLRTGEVLRSGTGVSTRAAGLWMQEEMEAYKEREQKRQKLAEEGADAYIGEQSETAATAEAEEPVIPKALPSSSHLPLAACSHPFPSHFLLLLLAFLFQVNVPCRRLPLPAHPLCPTNLLFASRPTLSPVLRPLLPWTGPLPRLSRQADS